MLRLTRLPNQLPGKYTETELECIKSSFYDHTLCVAFLIMEKIILLSAYIVVERVKCQNTFLLQIQHNADQQASAYKQILI